MSCASGVRLRTATFWGGRCFGTRMLSTRCATGPSCPPSPGWQTGLIATDYFTIKAIHQTAAALSLAGFLARGLGSLAGGAWVRSRAAKTWPHVVDSVPLLSAFTLAWMLRLNPTSAPWLMAKIGGLVVYIALGMVALRPDFPLPVRMAAWQHGLLRSRSSAISFRWRSPRIPQVTSADPGACLPCGAVRGSGRLGILAIWSCLRKYLCARATSYSRSDGRPLRKRRCASRSAAGACRRSGESRRWRCASGHQSLGETVERIADLAGEFVL